MLYIAVEWTWRDAQFDYRFAVDGHVLLYRRKLRHGGHLPTGPIDAALAVGRAVTGKPQAGESDTEVDLYAVLTASFEKRPYRGYSAFRKPLIIFSGMFAAGGIALWRTSLGPWTDANYAWVIGSAVATCFIVDMALARLFPHLHLVLVGHRTTELDVHAIPKEIKPAVLEAIRAVTSSTS